MNAIGIKHVPDWKNEDVVLLAGDADGLAEVQAAVTAAQQHGSSQLQRRVRLHEFTIEPGAADIELSADRVLWRLDSAKAAEITAMLTGLVNSGHPCHNFVEDMASPAPTLVLSHDQYLRPSWLTAGKTPLFPEGFE